MRLFVRAMLLITLVPAILAQSPRLDGEPRAEHPPPPESLEETIRRFLPVHEPLYDVASFELDYDADTYLDTTMQTGACYAAAAYSDGITDLDLWVYADGEVIAQDVQPDHYPVVEWCAPRDADVQVRAHAFEGEGSVQMQILAEPASYSAAAGEQDELSNRLTLLLSHVGPRYRPMQDQWRERFSDGMFDEFAFDVGARRCYLVVAVGDSFVDDVDLMLVDSDGETLASDFAVDATPAVLHCTRVSGELTARVIVVRGQGTVAAQVFSHAP